MRPLLISYGGGHANIMIALARELAQRGIEFDLIGLTTAFAAFQRAGLDPVDVTALLDPAQDQYWLDLAAPLIPADGHPDISHAQTHAYFALGLADLAGRAGEGDALRQIAANGRKAFAPVSIFRRYFARARPSVVVATTSPRFELAAIRAARASGVPTLAVGDHFLVGESEAITSGDFAEDLVVLAEGVAERLRAFHRPLPRLHVLGNPAFDVLAARPSDAARRAALRKQLGLADCFVLFWPLGGASHSGNGERLLPAAEVTALLGGLARERPGLRYLLRAHPNWPVTADPLPHGVMCPSDLSPEDCLLVADLVVAESTTLGLQALLRGVPVIAYGHGDLTQYPHFGWASLVHSAEELRGAVLSGDYLRPPPQLAALVGLSAARTVDLIEQLHGEGVRAAGLELMQ